MLSMWGCLGCLLLLGDIMKNEDLAYMGRIYKSLTGTPDGIFLPDNRLGIPSGYCSIETIKKMVMVDITSPEKVEFLAEMMEDFYDQNIVSLLKEYKNSPSHIEIILNNSISQKLKDAGIELKILLGALVVDDKGVVKLSITEIERALDIILK